MQEDVQGVEKNLMWKSALRNNPSATIAAMIRVRDPNCETQKREEGICQIRYKEIEQCCETEESRDQC